ncbi:MAG: hypothetical protein ACK5BN_02315, partial [Planctomycetota bacterium]
MAQLVELHAASRDRAERRADEARHVGEARRRVAFARDEAQVARAADPQRLVVGRRDATAGVGEGEIESLAADIEVSERLRAVDDADLR